VSGEAFDSYKQDPPDDLDVFEFDGIGLDYYVRNNFVTLLSQNEVGDSEDILDFAWKGRMVDGRIYAIPRIACTYVLIYRKCDADVAGAVGLQGLHKVLGDGPKKLATGQTDPSFAEDGPPPLYAVTCRSASNGGAGLLETWTHPLALGQPLPTLPLWLAPNLAVSLELDLSYEETCRILRIP
jgi:hypothetical protein